MKQQLEKNRRPSHSKRTATTVEKTKKVVSDFPIALYRETDRAAAELKLSRSAIIRRAMEELLGARRRRQLRADIAEYFESHADAERQIMEDFRYVDTELR